MNKLKIHAVNRVFNPDAIKYITWWESIILWFIPAHVEIDSGRAFVFKKWRGRLYLIDEHKKK